MKILLSVLLSLNLATCFAQDKLAEELLPDLEWGEGSIMLNDNSEIKGMIRYNDKSGLVSYESGSINRSFNARAIQGFEFFDERVERQRVFFTLPFQDEDSQMQRPEFFEVLKDMQAFAVLSRINAPKIKISSNNTASAMGGLSPMSPVNMGAHLTTDIRQTETVYILTPEGDVKSYMEITRKVVDRVLYDREKKKKKIVDKDIFKQYFVEPGYSRMIEYAEANDLDFREKEDFIKMLEEYKKVMVD